jgi:hypothetical protein
MPNEVVNNFVDGVLQPANGGAAQPPQPPPQLHVPPPNNGLYDPIILPPNNAAPANNVAPANIAGDPELAA